MNVLVAYDGSDSADAAIGKAAELLTKENVDAVVLSVWEPLTVSAIRAAKFGGPIGVPLDVAEEDKLSEEQAQRVAEHGAELATTHGFGARAVAIADTEDIAGAVVAQANELGADLIVMGARGLAGVRALIGSVSSNVVQHAHRPVLIIPPTAAQGGEHAS
jgi:nucleotide-binding universal stress UspA family protein